MKKKLFTLMTFMLCVVASSHADETATVVKTWDFTSVSSTDATAFTSNTNWGSETNYYKNASVITDFTEFKDISILSGLQFKAHAADDIRLYTNGHGLRLEYAATNNTTIKISGLKANQIISVSCESASTSDERGVIATNVTPIGTDNSFKKTSKTAMENVGYVTTAGDVEISANVGDIYITKISISDVIENPSSYTETITLNGDGINSFSTDIPLDFSSISNIRAYYSTGSVTGNNGARLTRVSGFVPAGTGLILQGDAKATANVPLGTNPTSTIGSNNLVATVVATEVPASTTNSYNYIFGKDSQNGIGFYLVSGSSFTSGAKKAYLRASSAMATPSTAKFLSLIFDDETNGINTIKTDVNSENNVYYTLSGVRVSQPQKGLYILNGKKVLVK